MPERISPNSDASSLRIGIAVSRYHAWATDRLLEGAMERFRRLGGREEALVVAPTAGTWELTAIVKALASRRDLNGVVALGVVIRGETPHFDYICDSVTRGITDITLTTGMPVGFGVLTCETTDQVEARAGGAVGNKGAEAMQAVIESAQAIIAIQAIRNETPSTITGGGRKP